jgi:hypothetical protein
MFLVLPSPKCQIKTTFTKTKPVIRVFTTATTNDETKLVPEYDLLFLAVQTSRFVVYVLFLLLRCVGFICRRFPFVKSAIKRTLSRLGNSRLIFNKAAIKTEHRTIIPSRIL